MKLLIILALFIIPLKAQPHPSVTLAWSWTQGTGDPATGFHVQRATVSGGPYVVIATTSVTALGYLDVGVMAGATYYYVITAFNSAGDSSKSGEVACTLPFQIPGAPAGLSGSVK